MSFLYLSDRNRAAVAGLAGMLLHLLLLLGIHLWGGFEPHVPEYAGLIMVELADFAEVSQPEEKPATAAEQVPAPEKASPSEQAAAPEQTAEPKKSGAVQPSQTQQTAQELEYRFQKEIPDGSLNNNSNLTGNQQTANAQQAAPSTVFSEGPTEAEIALRRDNLVAIEEWLKSQPDLSSGPGAQDASAEEAEVQNEGLSSDRLAEIDAVLSQLTGPNQQVQKVDLADTGTVFFSDDSHDSAVRPAVRLTGDRVRIGGNDPRLDRALLSKDDPPVITAMVSFIVDPQGRVIDLQLEKSSGNNEIDARIRAAVQTWRFTPASDNRNARGEITYSIRKVR